MPELSQQRTPMSLSTVIVLSLLAGLATGVGLHAVDVPSLHVLAHYLEPVGTLWLNALRMTVVPLVVALLITGAASATETASTGRLAARALLLFVALLTAGAVLGALLVPASLAWWPVDAESAAALRAGASSAEVQIGRAHV